MERLTRVAYLALFVAGIGAATGPPVVAGGGGAFGDLRATALFDERMRFSASWEGSSAAVFELLLGFGSDDRLVVPVPLVSGNLDYTRDMTGNYVPPNTEVSYQWRAVDGGVVTLSEEGTLLYDDDRQQWEQARIGSATVHWYGANESIARRFGALAGGAADRAADLLGHPLSDPVDIFVYDGREAFLGAIGPGSREWIGAATFSHIRTVYMWLEAGSNAFLETTLAHEVTHVVFADASDNPYHVPATWINEGVATWSELQNAEAEHDLVAREAEGEGGLFAFEALTDQFPIDQRGATLAYAQSATMIDFIIDQHGPDALAAVMTAFRNGASDREAVEAGTGVSFDELSGAYFASFGVEPPAAVTPIPLRGSDVPIPRQPDGTTGPTPAPEPSPGPLPEDPRWVIIAVVTIGAVLAGVFVARRRPPPAPPPRPPGVA